MFFKKVKKADLEAVSSRNADQERQENKMMRAWISFGVVIILLILLFFASINIGSLKVGCGYPDTAFPLPRYAFSYH